MADLDDVLKKQTAKQQQLAYQTCVQKLESVLLSITGRKSEALQAPCAKLIGLPAAEREEFVRQEWGEATLDSCMPLLLQLSTLEAAMRAQSR